MRLEMTMRELTVLETEAASGGFVHLIRPAITVMSVMAGASGARKKSSSTTANGNAAMAVDAAMATQALVLVSARIPTRQYEEQRP